MSIYLSPGVYVKEVDLSLYVPNLSTTTFGCVGLASKGPLNKPTLISDNVQFSSIFGEPNSATSLFGPYAGLQYLSQGRQLWYVRVSATDANGNTLATKAALTVNESVDTAYLLSAKTSDITLTTSTNTLVFNFDSDLADYGQVTVTVPITAPNSTSQTFTMQQIAGYLNSTPAFAFWATASVTAAGKLLVTHNFKGASHNVQAASGAPLTTSALSGGFGFASTQVTGTGKFLAAPQVRSKIFTLGALPVITGSFVGTPTFEFKYTFRPANTEASITVRQGVGGDSANVHAVITGDTFPEDIVGQDLHFSSTAHTVVTRLSPTEVVWADTISTTTFAWGTYDFDYTVDVPFADYGASATVNSFVQALRANTAFTSHFLAGVPVESGATYFFVTPKRHSGEHSTMNIVDKGTGPGFDDTNDVYVNDFVFGLAADGIKVLGTSPTTVLGFTATSEGTWGNGLSISIENAGSSTFNVVVWEKGTPVERYNGLTRSAATISVDAFGTPGPNPKYVETAINGFSARITVVDLLKGNVAFNTYLPEFTTKQPLSGGDNGMPATNDVSAYIGTVSDGVATGLQTFRNPEEQDVNLIAVPGISDAAVINEMINICEARADCMALVDPPRNTDTNKDLTPQQVADWHNGAGVYADHQAFNSSYAALYWPWAQIYDPVNKVDIWTPPSGHIAGAYAFNDYNAEAWYAPAGLNRGHLTAPIAMGFKPTQGHRDFLYSGGNAVNPIATFHQQGINIWGQRTLQRKPSALDRVTVRRLLLYLEKVIATATRFLLFQPNNANSWTQFIDLVTPILDGVQGRNGLTGFKVRCDAVTNTPDVIANNQMNALIFIKPVSTIETVQLTMVLTDQGSTFSEIVF